MTDSAGWGERLPKMHSVVKQWMDRTSGGTGPVGIAAGSSLAGDDKLFPRFPVSTAVWHGLLTAVEHLDFFHTALSKSKAMYPSAYYTSLRAALIGSAQAVWVLAPASRPERQRRGLVVAATDAREHRKAIREYPASNEEERRALDAYIQKLTDRLDNVDAAGVHLGFAQGQASRWDMNTTDVIRAASELALGADLRPYAMVLWRTGSGHVHGQAYARLLQLDRTTIAERSDGALWGQATTSLDAIGPAAAAPLMIAKKGWELYDQRRSRHQ